MLKRLGNLITGFLGLFTTALEKRNPEALLEVEHENLRKQIGKYNQGLAAHAGLCERLITQVKRLENEELSLRAQTAALSRVRRRQTAGTLALRLQVIQRELQGSRVQLARAEEVYHELIRARDVAFKNAQAQIQALRFKLDDLKVRRATAELTEMASGMIMQIGGSGDTLKRLQELVEQERDKAEGNARIARDAIDATGSDLDEAQQTLLCEQALTDFEASEGIALEGQQLFDRSQESCRRETADLVSQQRTRIQFIAKSGCENSKEEKLASDSAEQAGKS